jgi:hypothetical protein
VAISIVAALLPVLVFLAVLLLMDSFKLVPFRAVSVALLAGAVSALAALAFHSWLLAESGLSTRALGRYVGPVTEEILKAVYVVIVLRLRRPGKYLSQLKERFPGPVVADIFCQLRVELELAIRAKGMRMARETGLEIPADPDVKARLHELRFLQGSIGPAGLLALKPLRVTSHRDDWHTYLLEQAGEGEETRFVRAVRVIRRRFTKEDS